jgi:hypothetical protein
MKLCSAINRGGTKFTDAYVICRTVWASRDGPIDRVSRTIVPPLAQSRSRAAVRTVLCISDDLRRLVSAEGRSRSQLAAENLFLRKQLALYVERQVKPRRADNAADYARRAVAAGCMASPVDRRQAGHTHPMASKRFPVALALEIETTRPAAIAGRPATVDRRRYQVADFRGDKPPPIASNAPILARSSLGRV